MILSSLLVFLLSSGVNSWAQSPEVDTEALAKDTLGTPDTDLNIEEAPPPEAPYPNAKTDEPTENKSLPKAVEQKKWPGPVQAENTLAPLKIDQPKAVDEDGTYIFGSSAETDERKVEDVKLPVLGDEPRQSALQVSPPIEIKASGDYFYGYEKSTHDRAAYARFGYFEPPAIRNPTSNFSFKDLYTRSVIPTLFVDYEYQFNGRFGSLGLRAGTGLFYANGTGRFIHKDAERSADATPDISFNFIMLPNTLTGIYHFQYWDKQLFVPYVGGGAGYFIFSEIRDDGGGPKFGGAGVGVAHGGLNILADNIDPTASRELESEYGISHISINLELSEIIGLNPQYDFSSSVICLGVNMEF